MSFKKYFLIPILLLAFQAQAREELACEFTSQKPLLKQSPLSETPKEEDTLINLKSQLIQEEDVFLAPLKTEDLAGLNEIEKHKSLEARARDAAYFGVTELIGGFALFRQKKGWQEHHPEYLFGNYTVFWQQPESPKPKIIGQIALMQPSTPDSIDEDPHNYGWSQVKIDIDPRLQGQGFDSKALKALSSCFKLLFNTQPLLQYEVVDEEAYIEGLVLTLTGKAPPSSISRIYYSPSPISFTGIQLLASMRNPQEISMCLAAGMSAYEFMSPHQKTLNENFILFRTTSSQKSEALGTALKQFVSGEPKQRGEGVKKLRKYLQTS